MPNPPPAPPLKNPLTERDHVLGPVAAKVTLVEYGDYQCPHCRAAVAVVTELREKFEENLRFAYRHFPLVKLHPQARLAAEVAEAAGAQGKFWEMHDLLFRHQKALSRDNLMAYATELGLDIARVASELDSKLYETHVREDLGGGIRSGVNGTPTFFVAGLRHNGGYAVAGLVTAIEQALAAP